MKRTFDKVNAMTKTEFDKKLQKLTKDHEAFLSIKNVIAEKGNGIYQKYINPVVTAEHTPVFLRYDLNY